MKVILTDHAKERIRERKISLNVIRSILLKPDAIKLSFDGREVATRVIRGQTLEAVYIKEKGNKYLIITVYYGN